MTNTKRSLLALALAGLGLAARPAVAAAPTAAAQASSAAPDYAPWGELLSKYYDPARGWTTPP